MNWMWGSLSDYQIASTYNEKAQHEPILQLIQPGSQVYSAGRFRKRSAQAGKVHDVTVAKTLKLQPGTIIVDDRGYNDYDLLGRWTLEGVYFVTRLKDKRGTACRQKLPVPGPSATTSEKTA